MRISGVPIPPGYVRWAVSGVGLLLLAALVAIVANLLGLTGSPASEEVAETRVRATVSAAVPCDRAGAAERVRYTRDGQEREVRFDGCGHAEGEQVEVAVPAGGTSEDVVVHAARAAVDDGDRGAGLGTLLLLTASAAGAGYAYLLRRGQATSAGGASQVLH